MDKKLDKVELIKRCNEAYLKIEKDVEKIITRINEIEDVTEKGALITYIVLTLMSRSRLPPYVLLGLLEIVKFIILDKSVAEQSGRYNYYA